MAKLYEWTGKKVLESLNTNSSSHVPLVNAPAPLAQHKFYLYFYDQNTPPTLIGSGRGGAGLCFDRPIESKPQEDPNQKQEYLLT